MTTTAPPAAPARHIPVHPSLALESMRHSDFDTQSALGELIDNSIQAHARHVRLRFKKENLREGERGRPKWRVASLVVADDGHGMTEQTIFQCLQLGYSDRYDDRSGIGRFGVGMTLGGISQCRRIEVYSKPKDGEWRSTYLDLDEIKAAAERGEIRYLPDPEKADPPADYKDLLSADHGTIVIWKKIDRIHTLHLDDIAHWIGRTYRKWLAPQILQDRRGQPAALVTNEKRVDITLFDGTEPVPIQVYDPLYVIPYKEVDAPAELVDTIEIPIEVDDDITQTTRYSPTATVKVRLSLLPPTLRPERGWANSTEAKERYIDEDHCGVSILREGREVYYGSYVSFFKYFQGPEGQSASDWARLGDRYWGAEIEFPATLDNRFKVRNIKVGAKPIPELADTLKDRMASTIVAFRRRIIDQWDAREKLNREKGDKREKHGGAERTAATVPATPPPTDALKDAAKRKELETLLKPELDGNKSLDDWLKAREGPFVVVPDDGMHPAGPFIEIRGAGGKTIITYASRHPFFKLVDSELHEVSVVSQRVNNPESQKLAEAARTLRAALDLFLMGYAEAYNRLVGTSVDMPPLQLLENQINQWGLYVKQTTDRYLEKRQQDDSA